MQNQSPDLEPLEEGNLEDPEKALREVMGAGPMLERTPMESPFKGQEELPPVDDIVQPPKEKFSKEESAQSEDDKLKSMLLSRMELPNEEEIQKLKQQHRVNSLTVVPFALDGEWNKLQPFVLKSLTRARWRLLSDKIKKKQDAGAIPANVDPEDLFAASVVAEALVFPQIAEGHLDAYPAGLVPTLYAVIHRISWFFEPERLLNLSITL